MARLVPGKDRIPALMGILFLIQLIASKGEIRVNVRSLVLWRSVIFLTVSALALMMPPSFAQSENTYAVANPQGGEVYDVNYTITSATIDDMRVNLQDTSLVILMNSTGDGNLMIDLPRTLIDAKTGAGDDQFIVLVDDTYTTFHETKTNTDRSLSIPFSGGSGRIEIIGTQVVPEFGSISLAILALAVVSVLAVSAKKGHKFSI